MDARKAEDSRPNMGINFMAPGPFENINLATASEEDLARLKAMSDDDLLRSALSPDLFAVVESSRRLREALHKEERAIKRLTAALLFFIVVLAVMTAVLVWLGFKTLHLI
jgi:hypothetical protein